MRDNEKEFIKYFRKKGGLAGYSEIIKAGFSKVLLKTILNSGRIEKIDRGLYKLSDGVTLSNPDFAMASIKIPKGVVCLLSALAFHEVTNEIPRYVDIAIPRGVHENKIKYPPVKFYRFASESWKAGIEEHEINGRKIRVYNLAKTIADCFKFRNKIGMDVVRAVLKTAINEKGIKPKEIMRYSKICRIDNIIKPILEAIL